MSLDMFLVRLSHILNTAALTTVVDNVIGPQGLLATKARILVTNSIAFVKQFDSLIYLRRGIIFESGSYQKLNMDPESEISKLV